jgi:hypothetical protein
VKYLRDAGGPTEPDVRAVAGWPNKRTEHRNAS